MWFLRPGDRAIVIQHEHKFVVQFVYAQESKIRDVVFRVRDTVQ